MFNILFVCMGNICRSPTAEGIFIHHVKDSAFKARISTDSSGTHGYHIDHPPDTRAIATAAEHGVDISQLRARKVKQSDFEEFDLIIAMDNDNLAILKDLQPQGSRAQLKLMLDYLPRNFPGLSAKQRLESEVPDPYYGDLRDFEYMYELLVPASVGLLKAIEQQLSETQQDSGDQESADQSRVDQGNGK